MSRDKKSARSSANVLIASDVFKDLPDNSGWDMSPRMNSLENNDLETIDPIPDNTGDWKLAGT
jgi:hypothetical protein